MVLLWFLSCGHFSDDICCLCEKCSTYKQNKRQSAGRVFWNRLCCSAYYVNKYTHAGVWLFEVDKIPFRFFVLFFSENLKL